MHTTSKTKWHKFVELGPVDPANLRGSWYLRSSLTNLETNVIEESTAGTVSAEKASKMIRAFSWTQEDVRSVEVDGIHVNYKTYSRNSFY